MTDGDPGKNREPLSDRIKNCPIHQVVDVNGYLTKYAIPERLWDTFHEVVIARGKYPYWISDPDSKLFAREARQITGDSNMDPRDGRPFLMMFAQFINEWGETISKSN